MVLALYPSWPIFPQFLTLIFPPSPTVLHRPASLSFSTLAFESPLTLLALLTTPPTLPLPPPLVFAPLSPRLDAGHEQNPANHGEGRHAFLQRFLHHAHVLPVPLLHPHGEICAQPPHLHEQRELLLALVAGAPRAAHLRRAPQQLRLQDR